MDLFGTQEKGQKRRSQQNGSEFKNLERGKKKSLTKLILIIRNYLMNYLDVIFKCRIKIATPSHYQCLQISSQ